MADDDEEAFGGAYEDGHWIWDENLKQLTFMSDLPSKSVESNVVGVKLIVGASAFRELDLIEQMRYRKRYFRKLQPHEADVMTLQDVKDFAIYTAPRSLLSVSLINILHLPTTERFIRALIFYCQYYLQIAEKMAYRMLELEKMVRTTSLCEEMESRYRENLSDLRVMVAKEYSTILLGGNDTKKFHHLGPEKKLKSLSAKDAKLFETLVRMSIQIVWLALGRRSYNEIEMEISRLCKSDEFNFVEHTLKTGYMAKKSPEERSVLLGQCVRFDKKLNVRSPLMNEVFCYRPIDYRMMGLGVIEYDELSPRLRYLLLAVAAPEKQLLTYKVTCGILGFPRSYFDTALHLLPTAAAADDIVGSRASQMKSQSRVRRSVNASSRSSIKSGGKDKSLDSKYIYEDIILPPKDEGEPSYPPQFPDKPYEAQPCNNVQRLRWQRRLYNLLHPPTRKRKAEEPLENI